MSDTGVVDQLRIPDWIREPAERAWRESPALARAFVGLALADILLRAVGILQPSLAGMFADPLALVAAFAPHDLWILLPAILLLRRPDAATATPWIFWSAVALAIVELVGQPVRSLIGFGDPFAASLSTWLLIVAWAAIAGARLAMARGLSRLNPRPVSESVEGLANLVAVGVIAQAMGSVVTTLTSPIDTGDAGVDRLVVWSSLFGVVALLAWGALLWVVVRGRDDLRRPRWALLLATVGAAVAGVGGAVSALMSLLATAVGPTGFESVLSVLGWTVDVLAPTLVIVAFALGLAEPPLPYQRPAAGEPPDVAPPPDAGAGGPLPDAEPDASTAPPGEGPAILTG